MSAIVSVQDVVKDFPLGKLVVHALRGVSVEIESGDFVTIAGPSGSGKTTLLNQIGCVDVPTSGIVQIAGQTTSDLSEKKLTELRLHKLGFIFQTFNLVSVLNVAQNVELPLLLKGGLTKGERDRRVQEDIANVDLEDQIRQRPNELSGGQRQRVAIARALVTQPAIVLVDEPTANLDSETGGRIIDVMKRSIERTTPHLFFTHDDRVMAQARRIIRLVDGKISDDEVRTVA